MTKKPEVSKTANKLLASIRGYSTPLPLYPREMETAIKLQSAGLIVVFQLGSHGMFARIA
jgi:hypothetical protein